MKREQRLGEIMPAELTPEQRLQDKVDLLQGEVDRLRALNFRRGARLAAGRQVLRGWYVLPADSALRTDAARDSVSKALGVIA